MANEIRARFNLVNGTLSSTLTNVATTMSSAGLANLGVIDATNYAAITIENEIVWVTAHTAASSTATILRAQENTAAAAHGTVAWQHGPTAFDLGIDWTTFTPTLTQFTTATKTVTYAKYTKHGRTVTVAVSLAVTGGGTASSDVLIGLPVAAVAPAGLPVGTGTIYNASNFATYPGIAEINSSITVRLRCTGAAGVRILGSTDFTEALASGDSVNYTVTYESLA